MTITQLNPANAPVDFYYWPTPNGQKVAILLEEMGMKYRLRPINISKGEQFSPEYARVSPNQRMPAIVDHISDVSVFESGAILLYFAEKLQRFIPSDPKGKAEVTQWLFWQMSAFGPILGQAVYFREYAPQPAPLAIERFTRETARLYRVLDTQLEQHEFIAGEYSIADMAAYPWACEFEKQGQSIDDFPHVKRWLSAVGKRAAVQRAYAIGENVRPSASTSANRAALFAQRSAS